MVYFDLFPFPYYEFCSVAIIIPSLVFVVWVDARLTVPFEPDVKLFVVPPRVSHQLFRSQVLFSLPFVEIKHQKEQLFGHFRHH